MKEEQRVRKRHSDEYAKGYANGAQDFELFFRDEILERKTKIADSLRD